MKDVLRKYVEEGCTAREFKQAVSMLAGLYRQGELNDFMQKHWNEFKLQARQGETRRFMQVLDAIHHQINLRDESGGFIRRLQVNMYKIAAILLLPLLVVAGFYLLRSKGAESPVLVTMATPSGIQSVVDLPDGTKVWLNSASELKFPASFDGLDQRTVHLSGEGYFEVTADASKPFIVTTDDFIGVRVTGTAYNISAYSNDPDVMITLVEGSVQLLGSQGGKEQFLTSLKAGEAARYTKESQRISLMRKANVEQYTAWKKGWLVFVDEPLSSVLRQMERKYNVQCQVADPRLLDYRITGTFLNETLEQFLTLIVTSSPIAYQISRPEKGAGDVFEKRMVILTGKK